MLTRRDCLAALGSVAGVAATRSALAQDLAHDYPTRPIRMIVPYATGGATDILARFLASHVDRDLKQSVVVDNRGGGASQIGTQAIATAIPDGYTIGMIDSAFVINPGLFAGKLPYDTLKDFAAISLVATAPLVLVVHPAVAATTPGELVALTRDKSEKLSFALSGLGTPVHLLGEQLRQVAGIDIVPVPYRGGGPAILDVIAGRVQMTFATIPSILDHVRAGRVRALAIAGSRSPLLPELPTIAEAGFPGVDVELMCGLIAPSATPAAIVKRLGEAASLTVRTEPLRTRLLELGFAPTGSTPEEFRERIQADIAKYARLIAAGNIKPN